MVDIWRTAQSWVGGPPPRPNQTRQEMGMGGDEGRPTSRKPGLGALFCSCTPILLTLPKASRVTDPRLSASPPPAPPALTPPRCHPTARKDESRRVCARAGRTALDYEGSSQTDQQPAKPFPTQATRRWGAHTLLGIEVPEAHPFQAFRTVLPRENYKSQSARRGRGHVRGAAGAAK